MTPSATAQRTLSTAEQRREEMVAAAVRVFAEHGYGAPTTEIARQAGISQAYLFRLFPTKEELFAAATKESSRRMLEAFRTAAASARKHGIDPLDAMGKAYDELLDEDRDVLLVQLHSQVASRHAPLVREAMQDCFRRIYDLVERESGASPEELKAWFAHGMLCNTMAAIGAEELDAAWAQALTKQDDSETNAKG